jgi:hypothetical protein
MHSAEIAVISVVQTKSDILKEFHFYINTEGK